MSNLTGLLTICRKAGRLVMGFDPMKDALTEEKACAVIVAADISPKTERKYASFRARRKFPLKRLHLLSMIYILLSERKQVLSQSATRALLKRRWHFVLKILTIT